MAVIWSLSARRGRRSQTLRDMQGRTSEVGGRPRRNAKETYT